MKKWFQNPVVKNTLSALAVAMGGFILLTLTFLCDALYQNGIIGLVRLFTPVDLFMDRSWMPPVLHAGFVLLIGLLTWRVFQSKLRVLYKAIYLTVPAAVVLATVGMTLYQWPLLSYTVGTLLCISTLYYFHRTQQPWLYTYTVLLVGVAMALFTLTGGEI